MGLSVGQVYNAARAGGFSPAAAVVATAIALAESGGNASARCHNCFPGVTEDSRGLWQINVDAHPDMAGWNLYDPKTNARAAYSISGGGKHFGAWSTYTSGAYLSKLGDVYQGLGISAGAQPPAAVSGAPVPGAAAGAGSTSGGVANVGLNLNPLDGFGLFSTIGSAIGKDVARIAITTTFIVGGVALTVVGLYKGVQPTVEKVQQVGEQAAGTAAKVAAL